MAKTNLDDNVREVLGQYVLEFVRSQTQVNQLQEQLDGAVARIKELEDQCRVTSTQPGEPSASV